MRKLLASLTVLASYSIGNVITFIISFSPIFFIDIKPLAMFFILLAVGTLSIVPILGNLGYIGLWTWGFIGALSAELNFLVVLFYIAYVIFMIYHVLMIFAYITAIFANKRY